MNRELEIRERVAQYGLALLGADRVEMDATRDNLEFYAYSDLRYLLDETDRLRADLAAMTAERDALKADIEAGRLVRYPDFPQDMNDILEPLKVQSALNSEVMKLNFRKEHRPKDVSILDYTVIAALNKVLEEAAKTALEGE